MSLGQGLLEHFLQLGVSVDADDVALKKGYRKAAMKVRHPDKLVTMSTHNLQVSPRQEPLSRGRGDVQGDQVCTSARRWYSCFTHGLA